MSFCQATLFGNIGQDIKTGVTKSGTEFARFSVAFRPGYSKDETCWINVLAYSSNASFCKKYFKKGSRVILTGDVTIETFTTSNGEKKEKPCIIVRTIQGCDNAYNNGSANNTPSYQNGNGNGAVNYNSHASTNVPTDNHPPVGGDMPDTIPF